MNLVIQGGALPTFLLERIVAATGASTVEPRPPQVVCLKGRQPHGRIRCADPADRSRKARLGLHRQPTASSPTSA
jgi:hypothetical protein